MLRQWEQTREDMARSAESLMATLSEPNRRRVELKLAEMAERWSELNEVVLARVAATKPVLRAVERFWEVAAAFEDWLAEGERRMAECGSIGTDEERLVAQAAILDVSLHVHVRVHVHVHVYVCNLFCVVAIGMVMRFSSAWYIPQVYMHVPYV